MAYAVFYGAYTTVTATGAYIHDYGQKLKIIGLDLPEVVEAHFSLSRSGESVLRAGACIDRIATIPIPDAMLEESGSFYCYIFGRENGAGRTQYEITIPVTKRPGLPTETTAPTEDDIAYFDGVIDEMEGILNQVAGMKNTIMNGLSIGEVETLEAGEEATASITEEEGELALNLGIPKGDKGEDAEAFCVRIMIPGNNQDPVADKTYSEIQTAIKQGKRVYAYAPEAHFWYYKQPDGPFEPDTVYELLWPYIQTTVNGVSKKYVFFGYAGIITDSRLPISLDNEFKILVEGFAIFNDGTVEARKTANAVGNIFQKKLIFDTAPTEDSEHPVTSGGVYTALEDKAGLFKVTITSTYDQQEQTYTNHTSDKTLAEILEAERTGKYVYAEHQLVIDAEHMNRSYYQLIDSSESYVGDKLVGYAAFGVSVIDYYVSSGQWSPRNNVLTVHSETAQLPERVEWVYESTVAATADDLSALEQRVAALEQAAGNT